MHPWISAFGRNDGGEEARKARIAIPAPTPQVLGSRTRRSRWRRKTWRTDWSTLAERIGPIGLRDHAALLTPSECPALIALYDEADRFRRRIVMQHHGYRQGGYQYFACPLPAAVANSREAFYARLAPIADRWVRRWRRSDASARPGGFPRRMPRRGPVAPDAADAEIRARRLQWAASGSLRRPCFPLQLSGYLLRRVRGGFQRRRFVLTNSGAPANPGRGGAAPPGRGGMFAVHHRRPEAPAGPPRHLRHGVEDPSRRGERSTLRIIFHDAA